MAGCIVDRVTLGMLGPPELFPDPVPLLAAVALLNIVIDSTGKPVIPGGENLPGIPDDHAPDLGIAVLAPASDFSGKVKPAGIPVSHRFFLYPCGPFMTGFLRLPQAAIRSSCRIISASSCSCSSGVISCH